MHLISAEWSLLLLFTFAGLLPGAESTFTFDQLWELEKSFWDSFLYPANLEQTQGNTSTIFAPDVGFAWFDENLVLGLSYQIMDRSKAALTSPAPSMATS